MLCERLSGKTVTFIALLIGFCSGPALAQTVTYKILTQTSWVDGVPYGDGVGKSGTLDTVNFTLYGTKGTAGPIALKPRAKGLNDGGGYDTFTVPADTYGVGDVGRVLKLGMTLDGADDWHAQTMTVVRQENGVDKDHSVFPFKTWLKAGSPVAIWIPELANQRPKSLGETIVLKEDWVVFNNLGGSVDRTMKESVTMTLDEGMWSSKTKEKTQTTEVTLGLASSVMGVDVSSELKASSGTTVGEASGGDLSFSKSVTREMEETIPAKTLLLKLARWEIQGTKRTLGPIVQWVPKPSTMTIAYTEPTEYVSDPNRANSLMATVDSSPISKEHMEIIREKKGRNFVVPGATPIAAEPQPVAQPQPVANSTNYVQNLAGSRWSYVWQGTEFQFTFGDETIDNFTNGYWPGVMWQPRGQNQALLTNKPRPDQAHLPPGAAYADKTMYLNFGSADSFTGVDWDGATSITGKRLR
jgi:hypothetical protein